MPAPRQFRAAALVPLLAAAALLVGCGTGSEAPPEPKVTADRPAPSASEFPSSASRSLGEVIDEADPPDPSDPVVTPGSQVFYEGDNRYSLTLSDRDQNEITDAEVALYVTPIPGGRNSGSDPYEQPALGPYPARLVSLATEDEFRADSTAENRFAASAVYVTEIPFDRDGDWRVEALIQYDGKLIAKSLPGAIVGEYGGIPRPGDRPPPIETPTSGDVAGDLSALSTRVPPSTQNQASFADVLGEKPVVLLFATPKFCQSRVCGPVVDVAEQVKNEFGNQAEFIQMEIYNDNDPGKGVRQQVRAFSLPSEPWLFVIGRDGTVSTSIEGAFGAAELREAVEEVVR